jgi:hypothetical protein
MNSFDHKDLGNHLLQLCPKVVKHPVYARDPTEFLIKFKLIKEMLANRSSDDTVLKTVTDSSADGMA